MQFSVVVLAFLVLAFSSAGNAAGLGTGLTSTGLVGSASFCQTQQNILQAEANRINTPTLPQDLSLRVTAVLTNNAASCANCNNLLIWQNKICLVMNLRLGLAQLQAIQAEADARAASTTTTVRPITVAPAA